MLDQRRTDRIESAARLESVWRDAQVDRREFVAGQLTPLMRALVFTGTVGCVMFLVGMEWLGGNPVPLWPKLAVLFALVLVSLLTVTAAASRYMTWAGWSCIALLQAGILLSSWGRSDSFGWLLPGFVTVIMASGPTWLNTRDFLIAMALSLCGPLIAWMLVPLSAALLARAAMFLAIGLGVSSVLHVFAQWQLGTQWQLQQRLAEIASTDMLTGIANRMHFFTLGNQCVEHAHQAGLPLCALYIDVDHFKSINDQYGHATGDDALQAVAMVLQEHLREGDVLGRVGGEEFATLLPVTGLDQAAQVGERMRSAVARLDLSSGALSISVGVAVLRRDDKAVNGLLAAADLALQSAKQRGRNQVAVAHAGERPRPGLQLVDQ